MASFLTGPCVKYCYYVSGIICFNWAKTCYV